jgi:hypothetical protein
MHRVCFGGIGGCVAVTSPATSPGCGVVRSKPQVSYNKVVAGGRSPFCYKTGTHGDHATVLTLGQEHARFATSA